MKNLKPTTWMVPINMLTVSFRSWYFLALYVCVLLWGTAYGRGGLTVVTLHCPVDHLRRKPSAAWQCMYVFMSESLCVYLCVLVCVCVCWCVSFCVYECVRPCVSVCMCICVHVCSVDVCVCVGGGRAGGRACNCSSLCHYMLLYI